MTIDNLAKLKTVKQFATDYPIFTQGAIRSYIFFEDMNGLKQAGAILRIGKRKILIDPEKFMYWIQQQNPKTIN